jgi:hypothetical protein
MSDSAGISALIELGNNAKIAAISSGACKTLYIISISKHRLGGELVALYLMESPKLDKPITKWKGATPSGEVEKVSYADGAVWIDKAKMEGFAGVPEEVWQFHIGWPF